MRPGPPVPHPAPPQPKPIGGPLAGLDPVSAAAEPTEVPAYLPVSHELRLPLNVGICRNCRRIFRSPSGGGINGGTSTSGVGGEVMKLKKHRNVLYCTYIYGATTNPRQNILVFFFFKQFGHFVFTF